MNVFKTLTLTIALTLCPAAGGALAEPASQTEAGAGEILVANVNGLVCDFCAQSIRKIVGKNDAVAKVAVDLSKGEVRVDLKPGKSLDDATLDSLIRKAGYSLVSVERSAVQ